MTLLSSDEQAIIAQCTPTGQGALALLRISGHCAIQLIASMSQLASGKSLLELPTHTIHVGWVLDDKQQHIDQVLFLLMHGPRTFTGQHTVEITCHNNPYIIASIIKQAISRGARVAGNGEFSRRAVLNNKIDLLQAEAIYELIHAQTELAAKASLTQLEGSLSAHVTHIEENLLQVLALCDASFEFLDEEIGFDEQILNILSSTRVFIKDVLNSCNYQSQIRNGIKIVLLGSVNTGKSSLFNALLAKERAIVTDIPGTTRDSIEAGIYRNGHYITLVDTAGIRQTSDKIEQYGQERSEKEAEQADIILLVLDSSRSIVDMVDNEKEFYKRCIKNYRNKLILIRNKIDLQSSHASQSSAEFFLSTDIFDDIDTIECIDCSCLKNYNIERIHDAITTKIQLLFNSFSAPFLINERQAQLLLALNNEFNGLNSMLEKPIAYELLALRIKDLLLLTSQLTGKSISEQSRDIIFKRFCVGK